MRVTIGAEEVAKAEEVAEDGLEVVRQLPDDVTTKYIYLNESNIVLLFTFNYGNFLTRFKPLESLI